MERSSSRKEYTPVIPCGKKSSSIASFQNKYATFASFIVCNRKMPYVMGIRTYIYVAAVSFCATVSSSVAVRGQDQPYFPFPAIPAELNVPGERMAYLLEHYWDNYDFEDTVSLCDERITEQGFVDFLSLLTDTITTDSMSGNGVRALCDKLCGRIAGRDKIVELTEKYLSGHASPMYDEALYSMFLDNFIRSAAFTDEEKSTFRYFRAMLSRNQVGDKATDFDMFTPDGERLGLLDIQTGEAKCIVLLFYDPECSACKEVTETMRRDGWLSEAVSGGDVTVIAVYTESDKSVWTSCLPAMPEGWINVTDHEAVRRGALYDLRDMPVIYLLDRNKTVLLRDATYGEAREECIKMLQKQ